MSVSGCCRLIRLSFEEHAFCQLPLPNAFKPPRVSFYVRKNHLQVSDSFRRRRNRTHTYAKMLCVLRDSTIRTHARAHTHVGVPGIPKKVAANTREVLRHFATRKLGGNLARHKNWWRYVLKQQSEVDKNRLEAVKGKTGLTQEELV